MVLLHAMPAKPQSWGPRCGEAAAACRTLNSVQPARFKEVVRPQLGALQQQSLHSEAHQKRCSCSRSGRTAVLQMGAARVAALRSDKTR